MTEDVSQPLTKKTKECSYLVGTVQLGTINLLGVRIITETLRVLIVKESSHSLVCPNQSRYDSLKMSLNFLTANVHQFSSKNSWVEICNSVLSPGMCDVKCWSNKTAGLLGKTTSNCENSNSVTSVSYEASKTSYFLGRCQVSNIHITILHISIKQHQHPN